MNIKNRPADNELEQIRMAFVTYYNMHAEKPITEDIVKVVEKYVQFKGKPETMYGMLWECEEKPEPLSYAEWERRSIKIDAPKAARVLQDKGPILGIYLCYGSYQLSPLSVVNWNGWLAVVDAEPDKECSEWVDWTQRNRGPIRTIEVKDGSIRRCEDCPDRKVI